jgi:hypothetical protein
MHMQGSMPKNERAAMFEQTFKTLDDIMFQDRAATRN